jgi:hypothetical protein
LEVLLAFSLVQIISDDACLLYKIVKLVLDRNFSR